MAAGIDSIKPISGNSRIAAAGEAYGFRPTQREQNASPTNDSVENTFPPQSAGSETLLARTATQDENQEKYLERVVEDANSRISLRGRSLRFRIDEESEQLQIQIVDSERDRVIRSIPSDEMLRLASRLREYNGIGAMVDQLR